MCITKRDKCPLRIADECLYGKEKYSKKCEYRKSSCLINKKKKEKKECKNRSLWIWISAGLVIIIGFFIAERAIDGGLRFSQLIHTTRIFDLGIAIGSAIIAGAIVARVIDIPRRLSEYKESFIDALSSNKYLNTLDEDRLTEQRQQITQLLHKKDVPNMPKGLIKLDEEICKLLKSPFYHHYEQIIRCSYANSLDGTNSTERKYIKKECSVKYLIYNPYARKNPIAVDLGMGSFIQLEDGEEPNDFFRLKKFSIRIDDTKEPYDMFRLFNDGEIKLGVCKRPKSKEGYNRKIFFDHHNKESFRENDIKISSILNNPEYYPLVEDIDKSEDHLYFVFADKIEVELKWTVLVPVSDLMFTKRLRYPVKYFTLDYFFEDTQTQLNGRLIGTLIDDSKISTTISDNGQHICIRTYDWLLPKNGAVIVMLPKN